MTDKAASARVRVRLVRPEDASQLVPVFEAFYGASFGGRVSEVAVAGRLRQASAFETVVVAEVEDTIVGFASLRVTNSLDPDPYAELTDLFVEPESRRLGVASKLVKYLEGIARERGATHLVVLTGTKNTEAQAFYRSAGYEEYAISMRKALKATTPPPRTGGSSPPT
jgi:ribosomal protein S18 acetylase RimI-like enzyme